MQLHDEVLKTLLYYDIWSHPLTEEELFTFLPVDSMSSQQFGDQLKSEVVGEDILEHEGHYFVKGKTSAAIGDRKRREQHAKRMWAIARLSTHIIKRFPFVRAVFVSGDLSKNATHANSDIDFFIVTEPDRLWITRTLLVLFKKVFLLNRKKFFCLNYFTTTENLRLDSQSIYQATEVATLKPIFNRKLFVQYMRANSWIQRFFPNYDIRRLRLPDTNDRASKLQALLEIPFSLIDASKLDTYLMKQMQRIWAQRYPGFDEETRSRIFKCTRDESRTFVGNFEEKILALYRQRLKDFGLGD